jgi:hypothetical protein
MKQYSSGLLIFMLSVFEAFSQYQANNNPLRLNPAFAGAVENTRISASSLFSSAESDFPNGISPRLYHVSIDGFVRSFRSGLGFYWEGGQYKEEHSWFSKSNEYNSAGLIVAPKYTYVNRKGISNATFSPALEVSFGKFNTKYRYLGEGGSISATSFSARVGALLNTKKYFCGIAARYLHVAPNDYATTNAHLGYTVGNIKSRWSFSPVVSITHFLVLSKSPETGKRSSRFYIEAINLNIRYRKFIFGAGYPHAMLGIQTSTFRIAAGFLYSKSKQESILLRYDRSTSVQLSLCWQLKKNDKRL